MLTIKEGVRLYGTRPEMVLVNIVVASVFNKYGYECVITSGVGKIHGDKSLHPVGLADDYRSKHIKTLDEKVAILNDLNNCLPCCDILLEYLNQEQEHLHIEFDPKDDPQFQADKAIYKQTGVWPS